MDLLTKRVSVGRQLSERKTKEEMVEENILENPQIADSLQPVAHVIEKHLNEKSQNKHEESNVAPSLQSRIKLLEERKKKHQLESLLLHRPDEEEMLRKHRLLYGLQMASVLQRYAKELEGHLRMRVGEEYLRNKGLLPYSQIPAAQRPAATVIDQHLAMHPMTRHRSNSDPSHLAPSLQGIAKELMRHQREDHLANELRDRHSAHEVVPGPRVAPSLAPLAQNMERNIKKKRLSEGLHARHSSEELEKRNVLYSASMSSVIQPAAHNVEELLQNQPTKRVLEKSGVLQNPQLAPDLQPVGAELSKKLVRRPQPKEMFGKLDPTLHQTAMKVKRAQYSTLVESQLRLRPEMNEVEALYSLSMASSIQPAALDVEMALQQRRSRQELINYGLIHNPKLSSVLSAKGYALARSLKHRPEANSIIDTNLAASLQTTAKSLAFHQRRESLSQLIHQRPSIKDESIQKNLQFSNIAPSLQPAAYDLEEELSLRPALKDLSKGGLFPFSFLPEHLRPNAWDLHRALERAKMAAAQTLESHGYPDLAPSLHDAARKTEKHLRQKSLKQNLLRRPEAEKVLGDTSIAPSIQSTANKLNQHFRRKSVSDALNSRPTLEEIWQNSGTGSQSQELMIDNSLKSSKKEIRITEMSNDLSENIDMSSGEEIVRILRQCDAQVFSGWHEYPGIFDFISIIALVMNHAVDVMKDSKNSRIVLSGCGTSGRLAYLVCRMLNDVLSKNGFKECCEYCIAGGDQALLTSQERPEDDPIQGVKDLKALTEGVEQVLFIGITCGLSAPYVGGQVEYAIQQNNFVTVLMGFNPSHMARDQPVEKWQGKTFKQLCETLAAVSPSPGTNQKYSKNIKHILLNPVIGPETITGSTRMKSGTATLVLLQSILIGALSKALSTQALEEESKAKSETTQPCDDDHNHIWNLLSLFESVYRNIYHPNIGIEMAKGMKAIANALLNNGRVIYVGNQGFSGISAFIDASEMKPTFGTEHDRYRTYLPEGWTFLKTRSGDISERGSVYNIDLKNLDWDGLRNNDVVVFINNEKPDVWALAKNSKAQLIQVHIGIESTRARQNEELYPKLFLKLEKSDILRSGMNNKLSGILLETMELLSAKLILNGLSTGGHVLGGCVYSNRMINVRAVNDKLFYRAVFLVQDLGRVSFTQAQECLLQAAYGDDVWEEYTTSPVSTHIQNISGMDKVVPVAIALACFQRLNNSKSAEEVRQMLTKEPCLRKILKKIMSL